MKGPRRRVALATGALGIAAFCVASTVVGQASAGASAATNRSADSGATARRAPHALPARLRALAEERAPSTLERAAGVTGRPAPGGGSRRNTVQYAVNWSGELETGTAFTDVSGSWTVPSVTPSTTPTFVATWVGIGGNTDNRTLIQTGTAGFSATGQVGYTAWVEMLTTPSFTATLPTTPGGTSTFTVTPGNVMDASVTNVGSNQWTITIRDVTKGWKYQQKFEYHVTASSAEWITERPTIGTSSTTSLATLADYGSTRFTQLEVARSGGAAAAPASLTPIWMVSTSDDVISAPGPVSASATTGESFTDSYIEYGAHVARVFGTTADATSAQELEHQFPYTVGDCPSSPTGGRAVVLATDKNYPDALASAYLASYLGTGTLLTPTTRLSTPTQRAIHLEGITHVYVVGGPLAISTAAVGELLTTIADACGGGVLSGAPQKIHVTRLAGPTEYDTAEAIVETGGATPGSVDLSGAYAGVNGKGGDGTYNATAGDASSSGPDTSVKTAIVATGTGFQDAESASALSYADHLPILLTAPNSLSSEVTSAIASQGIQQVVVMGGQLAVSDAVVSALEVEAHVSVLRVAGADDTQTAVELAQCELASSATGAGLGWPATGDAVVARGDFYADGLAGAVVAADGPTGKSPEPLLLTSDPTTVGPYLSSFLETAGTTGIDGDRIVALTVLGGPLAVTPTAVNAMVVDLVG